MIPVPLIILYITVFSSAAITVAHLGSVESLEARGFLAKPRFADPLWAKYNPAPPCSPLRVFPCPSQCVL